jgi:hypothetical protein
VQLGDQASRLGIVQAGDAIEDFFGIMHALGAGLVEVKTGLPELMAHGVAVCPRRFHDHGDGASQLLEFMDQTSGFKQRPFHYRFGTLKFEIIFVRVNYKATVSSLAT